MSYSHRGHYSDLLRPLDVDGRTYRFYSLPALREHGFGAVERLPWSLKILLENMIRHDADRGTGWNIIDRLADDDRSRAGFEMTFYPDRVLSPDCSAVPLLADLALVREHVAARGGSAESVNARVPLDVFIDHSIGVDSSMSTNALAENLALERSRNRERFDFLTWGENSFRQIKVFPPGSGISHQVNLEYLARIVLGHGSGRDILSAETLIGVDSHTPMINALGILGWGVGGVEAIAVLLGEPITFEVPPVIGVRLTGEIPSAVTATDLALRITERLRQHGSTSKFVEFHGPALSHLSLSNRATISNMAPEYGATIGLFPVDQETVRYLLRTGRSRRQARLVEEFARAQGLWHQKNQEPNYEEVIEVDLGQIGPTVSGPYRPDQAMPLARVRDATRHALEEGTSTRSRGSKTTSIPDHNGEPVHGDIVIAAITSCANTSNEENMISAGILARNLVERGLCRCWWVKASLTPGSRTVAHYLEDSGLQSYLDTLGFHIAGFGCATCMGNSGPLLPRVDKLVDEHGLRVAAVLSGNRNFPGRIHPKCSFAYLMSPPLVVAYAVAGTTLLDITKHPLGVDGCGKPVFLRDIWPSPGEVRRICDAFVGPRIYKIAYPIVLDSRARGAESSSGKIGALFPWRNDSTYILRPTLLDDMPSEPKRHEDVMLGRILIVVGDDISTDQISPVGQISLDSTAGRYLIECGVKPEDFNTLASRRANHEVMIRSIFSNRRLKNEMVAQEESGLTRHWPSGALMTIFSAAARYRDEGIPLVIVAGQRYGCGSARDWAAKGPWYLGVRVVIAESFERIHRSNLVALGILPLLFPEGVTRKSLHLDGSELIQLQGLSDTMEPHKELNLLVKRETEIQAELVLRCDIRTEVEARYWMEGGLLPAVTRNLLALCV
jgi:aconitate hydratase